jgi:hypothetical protein
LTFYIKVNKEENKYIKLKLNFVYDTKFEVISFKYQHSAKPFKFNSLHRSSFQFVYSCLSFPYLKHMSQSFHSTVANLSSEPIETSPQGAGINSLAAFMRLSALCPRHMFIQRDRNASAEGERKINVCNPLVLSVARVACRLKSSGDRAEI